ncbi:aromatic-ring-hydroxylating dioxygenase subunit beta [Streptomyces rugosispiralis]|uniref:3-phenylpropionate/cinnamic acid dioxygenase subunit beta n=1 Tax=Streptomyces rugosispiralis TaxID=2967341 RepID=A0ABT1V835_9ACTN|nr:3-phenylpropionate/cinnamic acid dioxygenase subunit beta [Streptomyces rugosispiralis]MCQ8192691.1 3-phenylpropionate/cinnamic acid dioxygenase subunit beta [Streptomyces rugosispiralis]
MTVEQVITALPSVELERSCIQFLYREAELLDNTDYSGWFETCLSEGLEYRIPIRTTRVRTSRDAEFSTTGFHMTDTYGTMRTRVNRLLTEHAWAEDPPSRTRRVVTNVRVRELGPDTAEVKSYLTLYRSQGDTTEYDLIVGERQDVLGMEDGAWRLRSRLVLLDHTILGTANLGVFL